MLNKCVQVYVENVLNSPTRILNSKIFPGVIAPGPC